MQRHNYFIVYLVQGEPPDLCKHWCHDEDHAIEVLMALMEARGKTIEIISLC